MIFTESVRERAAAALLGGGAGSSLSPARARGGQPAAEGSERTRARRSARRGLSGLPAFRGLRRARP